jgi:hypothetical protein
MLRAEEVAGALSHKAFRLERMLYCDLYFKKYDLARCWWLMPIILATQEAEIRRITV